MDETVTATKVGPAAIAAALQSAVAAYAQTVRSLFGERALGLSLYGAATTPGFRAGAQGVSSALVLDRIDIAALRGMAKQGPALGRLGFGAPLVLTPAYITSSLDSFPLEFMNIAQRHVVVFGEDHFAALTFHDRDVRLQCERELKSASLALRQGLLASAGNEAFIAQIERDLAEGLVRVMRGMLWLKGERESRAASDVLARLETLLNRRLEGIRAALDHTNPAGWREFDLLYGDVEAMGTAVNDW